MKLKKNHVYVGIGLAIGFVVLAVLPALALDGETQLKSFFDGTSGFLVKTVGSGVFLLGLIGSGIKISSGDQGGLKNAIMVTIGGAIIFLAKPILGVLLKLGGGN